MSPYDLRLPGGVQGQVLALGDHLRARGHDTLTIGPGMGVAARVVGWRANRSVAPVSPSPAAWRQVARRVRGADVVHVHEPFVPMVGLGALGSGVPTVATFHADPPASVRRAYRVLAPWWRRRLGGALTTAVSEVAAEGAALVGLRPRLVPNGLDVPSGVAAQRRRDPIVLFLGRDEPRKGLDDLLVAWRSMRRSLDGWELHVVGATRPDEPGVRFHGRVDEATKRSLLDEAAVLCAPNRGGESFGLVVAEGLAHGCAVLAADLPAFRAVAGDGARFAPPGDPAELARALAEVCADLGVRESLAGAGRAAVARFSWEVVAAAYESVYHEAVGAEG